METRSYDNPSTSHLDELDGPYRDEDLYKSPTRSATSYPPAQPKPHYADSADDDEYSHSRLMLKSAQGDKDARSCVRRYLPSSVACRLYLLVVLLQTAVDVAIESDILIQFDHLPPGTAKNSIAANNLRRLPVYLGIFAMAHVFQFILAVDAVIFRNTLQFVFLVIFNALILVYAAIQISEVRSIFPPNQKGVFSKVPITVLTDIIPIVIGLAEVAYIGLGWKIYTEFGWKLYKFLGADRRIKKMYAQYQIFECMIKFDVFFWLGFSVQFLGLVLKHDDFEFGLTIAALPISMLLLVQGHLAAKYENRWMMGSFLVGLVAGLAYFSYKMVIIIIRHHRPEIQPVFKSLAIFSAIAIVLLVTTFIWGVLVMRNFDHGLKLQLDKSKATKEARRITRQTGFPSQESHSSTLHPTRMTIE